MIILWALVLIYTFFDFTLLINDSSNIFYLLLLMIFAAFLLVGTGIKNKGSWLFISIVGGAIALTNAFSAVANIGANSLGKMIFDGSIRIICFILVSVTLYECSLLVKSRRRILLNIFIIGVTLQSLLSIIAVYISFSNRFNILSMDIELEEKVLFKASGLLSNPIYFSILVLISLLTIIYLLTSRIEKLKRSDIGCPKIIVDKHTIFYAVSIIVQLWALYLTRYYFALIVLFIFGSLYFLISRRMKIRYIILFLFITLAIVVLVPIIRNIIIEDLGIAGKIVGLQFTDKNVYASMEVGYNNLLFGVGNGNYSRTVINLEKGLYPYTPFGASTVAPNSSILVNFAENGIISVLLYLILFFAMLYKSLKRLILNSDNYDKLQKNSFIIGMVCIFTLFFLTTKILSNPGLMLLLFAIVLPNIIGYNKIAENDETKRTSKSFQKAFFALSILLSLIFAAGGIYYYLLVNKYGPIMENDRQQYHQNVQLMHDNIEQNLSTMLYEHEIEQSAFIQYIDVLEDFRLLVDSYVAEPNSRYYKCRVFKDVYAHLEDLNDVSDTFTAGSARAFFEITVPVNLKHYAANEVKLPYYSYEKYYFNDITDIALTYYIDSGYNLNLMQSMREAKSELLEKGNYEEFKSVYKEMVSLLDIKEANGKEYLNVAYYFRYRDYEVPWYSGMAQGVLLGITAYAYEATGDMYYYDVAQKLLPAFYTYFKDGGIMYYDDEYDLPFILEYTTTDEDRELNGCIIGALGLREWYIASGDEDALKLYQDVIQDVIYRLDDYNYDMDDLPEGTSWSKYSLTVFPVQRSYQKVHLNLLFSLSNDNLIKNLDEFEKVSYYLKRWTKAYEYRYPEEDISSLFKTVLPERLE